MRERTLGLIKPDAYYSGWTKSILKFYQVRGLIPEETHRIRFTRAQARKFYAEHEGKHFFNCLVLAMSSGSSVALIFRGVDVISRLRELNGAMHDALPGTVRHDFPSGGGPFNAVHGSANLADAKREITLIRSWTGKKR